MPRLPFACRIKAEKAPALKLMKAALASLADGSSSGEAAPEGETKAEL